MPDIDTEQTQQALAEWLPDRRWFQGKARTITRAQPRSLIDLGEDLLELIVDVTYSDDEVEHYQLPVMIATADEDAPHIQVTATSGETVQLIDALTQPAAARRYASLIVHGAEYDAGDLGVIRGQPVGLTSPELPDDVRVLRGEQSNTSVILGDELILKVLRRLESGEHPDIELTRGLTEAGFEHIPAQAGSLSLSHSGWSTALAVLSTFVSGAEDGWESTVAETTQIARDHAPDKNMLASLSGLGEAVGELHRVLERTFPSNAAGPADLSTWSHAMRGQLERIVALANERAPEAAASLSDVTEDLWHIIEELQGMPLSEVGPMTRVHGDLHLGQTLLHPELGWQILDFEGEPAKSLEERRQPSSPLRDVAGMIRSFDYAAAAGAVAAGLQPTDLPPALVSWREDARSTFLDGYAKSAPDTLSGIQSHSIVVTAFELDKAVYELGYELANRPSWVPIPVSGIIRAVHRYREAATDRNVSRAQENTS